jgi:hypothetical protein
MYCGPPVDGGALDGEPGPAGPLPGRALLHRPRAPEEEVGDPLLYSRR